MDGAALVRMLLTLGLMLAVPAAILWLLRRHGVRLPGPGFGGGRLQVVARIGLDQRHNVVLLRRDATEQLLLLGPTGVTILDPAISLSDADRALHLRQAEETERRARAAEAAARNARERIAAQGRRLVDAGRGLADRLRPARIAAFATLVEARLAALRPPADGVPPSPPSPPPATDPVLSPIPARPRRKASRSAGKGQPCRKPRS